jgi:hypothetical protein
MPKGLVQCLPPADVYQWAALLTSGLSGPPVSCCLVLLHPTVPQNGPPELLKNKPRYTLTIILATLKIYAAVHSLQCILATTILLNPYTLKEDKDSTALRAMAKAGT